MDGAPRYPFSALTDDEQRRIARCFYALRASIERDASSDETLLAYAVFADAYLTNTGKILPAMPKPSERRQWAAGVFVDLLRYVRADVWNSTLPVGRC
jgi:hypothetical protein